MWAIVCINTSKEFCKESYQIKYDDILIDIERGDKNKGHQLRAECGDDDSYKNTHQKIRCFLSEISWLYECEIEILTHGGSSNKNTRFEGIYQYYNRIQNGLDLEDYQQIIFDQKQQVALGIYREAISSKSIFYEFLCYSRIINLVGSSSQQQIKWINDNYHHVSRNKDKINEITSKLQQTPINQNNTLGDHIYYSGRCAIAHANANLTQTADPDNFNDYDRISGEVRLMHELVGIFLNKELGIMTERELSKLRIIQWFQNYYGKDVIEKIKLGNSIKKEEITKLPMTYIKLRGIDHEFLSFKNLEFNLVDIADGCMIFSNEQQKNTNILTGFVIDFKNSEMMFDFQQFYPNKKIDTEKQLKIDYLTFLKHYLKNGSIELYSQINDEFITRSNPHMFLNADINSVRTFRDSIDKELQTILNGQ